MESLDDIFLNARQLADPDERAAYLAEACSGDGGVRQRVEAMLRDAERAEKIFGQESPASTGAEERLTEGPGAMIGPYRLLEKIGEGGMGIVYLAEQREPVARQVALKIIKLGMDTREVVGRFEAERQALALMDHPNIAKVLEAGASASGRPYFVMELVRGTRITAYCNAKNLATRQRLDLFVQVCKALQHAHQKGIIHRDLKPSNILVADHDGVAAPKVIDFGIAKATTDQRLTDKTVFTAFQQFIGTPVYMSPEQANLNGLDIDTRTDIYSLGVLLYELLTGKTPFEERELLEAGLEEMRRTIREVEPVKPSTRLRQEIERTNTRKLPRPARNERGEGGGRGAADETSSEQESTSSARPSPPLHGGEGEELPQRPHSKSAPGAPLSTIPTDLDWIVMKCLEKDRARRYETANGLANDIERHLANEPVVARPPTAAYRFGKAFQRNKLAFSAAMAVATALVIGLSLSLWEAARANRAERQQSVLRQRAEAAATEADNQRKAAQAAEKLMAQHAKKLGEELYATKIERAAAQTARGEMLDARNELKACEPDSRGWEWRHLDALNPLIVMLPGIDRPSFTPDGRHLITCGERLDDRKVNLTDVSSGEVVATFPAPNPVHSLALSPDGLRLAFGDTLGNVFLWALSTRKQIWSVRAHSERPDGMVFSRDGTMLASASPDGSLKLLRVVDGHTLQAWRLPGQKLRCPAISPDGRRLTVARNEAAKASQRADITLWDTGTGDKVLSLQALSNQVYAITFSPDGRWLVTGGEAGLVQQWNAANGELVGTLALHSNLVDAVEFSADGRLLASASLEVQVREFETGRLIHTLSRNRGKFRIYWLAFSSDATKLAAYNFGSGDGQINLFDLAVRAQVQTLSGGTNACSVAFSADGRRVVSGGVGEPTRLWDVATAQMLRALPVHDGRFVAFSPDGRRVLSSGSTGEAGLWDVADGSLVRSFKTAGAPLQSGALSPDGRRVATAGQDKVLRLWDAATGRLLHECRGHDTNSTTIHAVAFSPDGSMLATGGADHTLRLWDAESGQLTLTLTPGSITAVQFSPDGKWVAGGGVEQDVRVWEVATGRLLVTLAGEHHATVWGLAFSPDGKRIVTGDGNGTMAIWDPRNGRHLLTLESTQTEVRGLAWSRDGATIASAGADGTIRLWQTQDTGATGISSGKR